MSALLAVSHGTDSVRGAAAIAALVDSVAERLPGVDVRSAFVDVQQLDAASAVRAIEGPVTIVPLLLSTGFHVRVDLRTAAAAHPQAIVTPPLGPDPRLAEILAERTPPHAVEVVLAAAGSRDPQSAPACERAAALLRERIDAPVHLAYLAARTPTLKEVAPQHPDAVIVPYLLAHGFFHDLATRVAPGRTVTAPLLDGDPTPEPLIDLVVDRYMSARDPR